MLKNLLSQVARYKANEVVSRMEERQVQLEQVVKQTQEESKQKVRENAQLLQQYQQTKKEVADKKTALTKLEGVVHALEKQDMIYREKVKAEVDKEVTLTGSIAELQG